jgi:hypothetical protein
MGAARTGRLGCQNRRARLRRRASRARFRLAAAFRGRVVKYPGLLLLPLLMVSDYLLTIAGARTRRDTYARHFATRHYELNPIWQKEVAKLRWFNPRHLLLTLGFTVFFVALFELGDSDAGFVEGVEGVLIGVFAAVNGRHLGNLATFAYLKRHPDAISGTVTMTHAFVLWLSTFQLLGLVVPTLVLALLSRAPMMIGFAIGAALLFGVHLVWIARYRRRPPGGDHGSVEASPADSSASGTNRP